MGEAKRRRIAGEMPHTRAWATGSITIIANNVECFGWIGTRRAAVEMQKQYLEAINTLVPISARSYAKRAAGYLMAYGMPSAGDVDLRPSNHGNRWNQIDIDLYKHAVLWLALREHIPNTGRKLEDVFVGKALVVMFNGDKEQILADTARELGGYSFEGRKDAGHVDPSTPLAEDQFQMMVAVQDENYRLDPRDAISMPEADLFALAGKPLNCGDDDMVYVPGIPIDASEADAMLRMMTIVVDATNPTIPPRTYAGFTNEELSGGKTHVIVR